MDADIKNTQDALKWLERRIHEEAEADGETTNEHAIQLGFIQNMLAKFPRRNCDVGTAEEQAQRFYNFCTEHSSAIQGMCDCKCPCIDSGDKCHCLCKWAQMPYEGGAK